MTTSGARLDASRSLRGERPVLRAASCLADEDHGRKISGQLSGERKIKEMNVAANLDARPRRRIDYAASFLLCPCLLLGFLRPDAPDHCEEGALGPR